jgi:hypothetical protein
LAILRENLPFVDEQLLDYVVNFLQAAHAYDERYTVRDGINIARYAFKMLKNQSAEVLSLLQQATVQILGEEALRYWETEPSLDWA